MVGGGWDDRFGLPGAGSITAVVVSNGQVYIGGSFDSVGNIYAKNVARWDGTNWWALGSGTNCGVNGRVETIAISGSNVYLGGAFTLAGDVEARHIVRWDGSSWHPFIEGGSNGVYRHTGATVYCIAVDSNYVYVGGNFSNAGLRVANNICRWNGSAWTTMTVGVNAKVYAIAPCVTNVYVGGEFTQAGNVGASRVARWEDEKWYGLDDGGTYTGVNNTVYALCSAPEGMYVGGYFDYAGSMQVRRIALWEGTNWSVLAGPAGTGVFYGVARSLTWKDGDLYAGGDFEMAGGLSNVHGIARWDGSEWSYIGSEGSNGVDNAVRALAFHDDDLFVGGTFTRIAVSNTFSSGKPAYRIARWDGGWHAIDTGNKGCEDAVTALAAVALLRGKVYVGGKFTMAGGLPATNIACWDGSVWSSLDGGIGSSQDGPGVYCLTVVGSNLVAGGFFETAGKTDALNIVRWDGHAWHPLGDGIGVSENSEVYALCANGRNLYAGGRFSNAGAVGVRSVARWDGLQWQPLGDGDSNGVNGMVHALAVRGGQVYVGGSFNEAGGVEAHNLARWDGAAWHPFQADGSNGLGELFDVVTCLAVCGSNLYAGGSFTTAGSTSAHHIVRWTGSEWVALEEGVGGDYSYPYPLAMAVRGSNLFVGGDFELAGRKPSFRFGIWSEAGVGSPDSDVDGLDDLWEWEQFGNLSSAESASDYDGDCFTDGEEQVAGTIPTDIFSFLVETSCQSHSETGFLFRWTSVSDREYTVSRLTNLASGLFVGIASNIAGVPPENTYTDTSASARGEGFYRVSVE